MKVNKILLLVIFMGVFACKKAKTDPPKVEFDFSEMPENQEVRQNIHVNDLEKLFTKEQNDELERYLDNLEKERGEKVSILTVPFKENLVREWDVTSSLVNDGVTITFSKSNKNIDIGLKINTDKKLIKKISDTIVKQIILPEFDKDDYYLGGKKGVAEIINNLECRLP